MKLYTTQFLKALGRMAGYGMASAALCVALQSTAYATGTPMGDVLCLVVDWMVGSLGYGLATIAIGIGGVGAAFGKISWSLVLTIMIGVVVMFGATGILQGLGISVISCN